MSDRRNKIVDALTGTMNIDPDEYSQTTSSSRLTSLGYAIAGWLYMSRRQKNTRIQAVATVFVMGMAFWLAIGAVELAVLILTVAMVWMAEFINAAVEAVVNIVSPEYHPMAKVSKDVAAGAVLLGVAASIVVGLLILGPPLLLKLGV